MFFPQEIFRIMVVYIPSCVAHFSLIDLYNHFKDCGIKFKYSNSDSWEEISSLILDICSAESEERARSKFVRKIIAPCENFLGFRIPISLKDDFKFNRYISTPAYRYLQHTRVVVCQPMEKNFIRYKIQINPRATMDMERNMEYLLHGSMLITLEQVVDIRKFQHVDWVFRS